VLIEVIACSPEDAIEAEQGGAGRIELVRELGLGGLTPPVEIVEEVVRRVTIPVRVMVREQASYAAGDVDAVDRLRHMASRFAGLRIDGVVIGFLRQGRMDEAAMDAVLASAAPPRATFHHAFDVLPDPIPALHILRRWPQVDRVLTSGGAGDWGRKAARIAGWTAAAAPDIQLLPGGGLDLQAVGILAKSGFAEAHVGRAARLPPAVDGAVSSRRVAELVKAACR
jgi:copper homeostasis protein